MVIHNIYMVQARDVEIFFDMPIIWNDFEDLVSPNENLSVKAFYHVY